MGACKKHAEKPAWGYSDCPGCEVERQREKIAELTALCDGYRGEVTALKAELADAKSISAATIGHQGSLLEAATGRAETAESALTRARAEGMEEGLAAAERILSSRMYDNAIVAKEVDRLFVSVRAAKEACRLAEQADKGEEE